MVTSEIMEINSIIRILLLEFDKMQVKLIPIFTRKSFDYFLISWVTNYTHNRGLRFLTCLLYRELHALKSLKHAFWLKFT